MAPLAASPRRPRLALPVLAALALPAGAARRQQRSGSPLQLSQEGNPVLDTPDLTAYDPTTVLCARGKDAAGRPIIQGWCRDWLACIRAAAQPQGDKAAVMAAWKPADCREVCGIWPVLTPPAKSRTAAPGVAATRANATAPAPGNATRAQLLVNATAPPHLGNATRAPVLANATAPPPLGNATRAPVLANATAPPTLGNATRAPVLANATAPPALGNATRAPALVNATRAAPPANATTGNYSTAALLQEGGLAELLRGGGRDCSSSCANFQESLSSCVATILFEPGKVAAMGIPSRTTPAPPAHCSAANATCLPDLSLRYQRCVARSARPAKDCQALKLEVADCQGCPELESGYLSKYHSFVGGCMAQLNAYWQATHPSAGGAALPGSTGCSVH